MKFLEIVAYFVGQPPRSQATQFMFIFTFALTIDFTFDLIESIQIRNLVRI